MEKEKPKEIIEMDQEVAHVTLRTGEIFELRSFKYCANTLAGIILSLIKELQPTSNGQRSYIN